LTSHAKGQVSRRGFTEVEVEQAIRTSEWKPAELGRTECSKSFPFNAEWQGMKYARKRVRPIFVETESEIVVVTVYTYYFQENR
jgi:hypothetical protein